MGLNDSDLIVKISADTKAYQNQLELLGRKTKAFEDKLGSHAKISAIAFAGLSATILGTTLKFNEFSKGFNRVNSLLDEGSFKTKSYKDGVSDLRDEVLKLGAKTGESFDVLNNALFDLISSGTSAEDSMSVLNDAVALAQVGNTDTATAVKALSASFSSFGEEAGTAREVSEKFYTAQKFGITDISKLANEFNKVVGLGKELGISFDEVLASSAALTANGAKPQAQAMTELKAALNAVVMLQGRLKVESVAVQNAMSLENIESVGLIEAFNQLKEATGDNAAEISRILGPQEAYTAYLSLTGAQSKLVTKIMKEMGDETKRAANFQEKLAEALNEPSQKLKVLKRTMEAIIIKLGEGFSPMVSDLLGSLTSLAASINSLDKDTFNYITSVIRFLTVLAGVGSASAIAIIGFVKIRNALIALRATTIATGLSATAMWGAITLGATVLITLLPEVIGYFKELNKEAGSVSEVEKKLKNLREERERYQKLVGNSRDGRFAFRVSELDKEIKKNEIINAQLLEKENIEKKQKESQSSGKSARGKSGSSSKVEDLSKENQLLLLEEANASQKRIELKSKEIDLLTKLESEKNPIIRDILTNRLHENRNLQLDAYNEEKEIQSRFREELLETNAEFQNMNKEQQDAFIEQNLELLYTELETEQSIRDEAAQLRLQRDIDTQNQFLMNKEKYGKSYAKLQKFLSTDEVKGFNKMTGSLVTMSNSRNSTLKAIGKAAAVAQIGIRSARGAMDAYTGGVAMIPGPGGILLGGTLAAAVVAYGVEQAGNVLAANKGGMVPLSMGIRGRDSVNATLSPREFVTPDKNYDETVNAVADSRLRERIYRGENDQESQVTEVIHKFEFDWADDAFDIIRAKFVEKEVIGI